LPKYSVDAQKFPTYVSNLLFLQGTVKTNVADDGRFPKPAGGRTRTYSISTALTSDVTTGPGACRSHSSSYGMIGFQATRGSTNPLPHSNETLSHTEDHPMTLEERRFQAHSDSHMTPTFTDSRKASLDNERYFTQILAFKCTPSIIRAHALFIEQVSSRNPLTFSSTCNLAFSSERTIFGVDRKCRDKRANRK
jgi:hypothetical protein